MIENLPSNAGVVGFIPGQGTKIRHATGQQSPHTATREAHTRQLLNPHALELMSCSKRCHSLRKPRYHNEDPAKPKLKKKLKKIKY